MAKAFLNEGRFPFVPAIVQRALIAPFAALGTRLGYHAVEPRYAANGETPAA